MVSLICCKYRYSSPQVPNIFANKMLNLNYLTFGRLFWVYDFYCGFNLSGIEEVNDLFLLGSLILLGSASPRRTAIALKAFERGRGWPISMCGEERFFREALALKVIIPFYLAANS